MFVGINMQLEVSRWLEKLSEASRRRGNLLKIQNLNIDSPISAESLNRFERPEASVSADPILPNSLNFAGVSISFELEASRIFQKTWEDLVGVQNIWTIRTSLNWSQLACAPRVSNVQIEPTLDLTAQTHQFPAPKCPTSSSSPPTTTYPSSTMSLRKSARSRSPRRTATCCSSQSPTS